MSPVTPGPHDDLVLLGRDPISPDALIRHVRQSHDGAVVTFDGSTNTLNVTRNPNAPNADVNVNFLMLVATAPTPRLTATVSGGSITISFPTQTGYSYQLQYKNNLTDATWSTLTTTNGTGLNVVVPDTTTGPARRFYRLSTQ